MSESMAQREMQHELERMRPELARLRADLTEARSDVARFEAALDVANRELAEARRERDFAQEGEENLRHLKRMWERECGYYLGLWREKSHERNRQRRTIRALVVAARAMWDVVRMYEGDTEDDQLRRDIRASTVSFIKCAERGQAEKE